MTETNPKREISSLDDLAKHAPPQPDGDPWAILLKPEMEADKIRCDAWKEEVQTLLIFAGLFSAVVTAFVIESYKFLRPDPNDIIISLLSQIANGSNSSSPLSTDEPATLSKFTQMSSSVRVNVFWFLSLILSLTTVLVGTIGLQWLREHQSYPGFSPRETLAVLHMRSEALKAWYVPQIFSALPLLLQGALVLFLAGLVDFALPLGMKLWIPISCVVGLTLLFLVVTTVLPTVHPLLLFSSRFSRKTIPTPCAFKSPQAQIFRTISGFILKFLPFISPTLFHREDPKRYGSEYGRLSRKKQHLFPYIYTIWRRQTWATFDLEWLSLRDAWHHGILDTDGYLYDLRQGLEHLFPLSDITQCLIKTITEPSTGKHTEEFLVAASHCFQEISSSVWVRHDHLTPALTLSTDRRNCYFEKLHQPDPTKCSISRFLLHGGIYSFGRTHRERTFSEHCQYVETHQDLFYQDQIRVFLDRLMEKHKSPALNRYRLELKLWTVQYLLHSGTKPFVPWTNTEDVTFLSVFKFTFAERQSLNLSYWVDILAMIFDNIPPSCIAEEDWQSMNPLYIHRSIATIYHSVVVDGMYSYGRLVIKDRDQNDGIADTQNDSQKYLNDIGDQYDSVFRLIAKRLEDEMVDAKTSLPSLLLYHSAIFLHAVSWQLSTFGRIPGGTDTNFSRGLATLVDAVKKYKDSMGNRRNEPLETRFQDRAWVRMPAPVLTDRFSGDWWQALHLGYDGKSGIFNFKFAYEVSTPQSPLSLDNALKPGTPAAGDITPTPIIPTTAALYKPSQSEPDSMVLSFPAFLPDVTAPMPPHSDFHEYRAADVDTQSMVLPLLPEVSIIQNNMSADPSARICNDDSQCSLTTQGLNC